MTPSWSMSCASPSRGAVIAGAVYSILQLGPAYAQRTDENAVKAAEDAFGVTTSGELRITRILSEGTRLHLMHLRMRARDRRNVAVLTLALCLWLLPVSMHVHSPDERSAPGNASHACTGCLLLALSSVFATSGFRRARDWPKDL